MERLAFLLGTWRATDKYEKTIFNPNGGEGTGFYKTIMGPGGFSLLTDYHYQAPHGSSSGHQLFTWEPKRGCYVGYLVNSSFPGCLQVKGNWEGQILVLSGKFETRGMKIAFRQTFSDVTEREMILRQYNSIHGGVSHLFGTTLFSKQTEERGES